MAGLTFKRINTEVGPLNRTVRVVWHVEPTDLGVKIDVSRDGIHVVSRGELAFDNRAEANDWNMVAEMAVLALKYIRQESRVPADDVLRALVKAIKVVEEDSP